MNWSSCVYIIPGSKTNDQNSWIPTLNCLPILFINVLNALFMFAGTVAVIFIIMSGIRYIYSNGDSKQLDSARKTFVFAIVGLFLVFFSYFIVNFIAFVTGVDCIIRLNPFSPTACS